MESHNAQSQQVQLHFSHSPSQFPRPNPSLYKMHPSCTCALQTIYSFQFFFLFSLLINFAILCSPTIILLCISYFACLFLLLFSLFTHTHLHTQHKKKNSKTKRGRNGTEQRNIARYMIDWYGQALFCYCLAVLLYFSLLVVLLLRLRLLCSWLVPFQPGHSRRSICVCSERRTTTTQATRAQMWKQRQRQKKKSRDRNRANATRVTHNRERDHTAPNHPTDWRSVHAFSVTWTRTRTVTATATTQAAAASTQLKINTAPMRRRCRFATWDGGDGDDDSGGTRFDGKC